MGWFCVEWQVDKRWEIEENEGLPSHPSACKLHAHPPVWEVLITLKSQCSTRPEVILPYKWPTTAFWYQKIRAGKEARREFHGYFKICVFAAKAQIKQKAQPTVSLSECFVLNSLFGFSGLPHFFSCDKRTNSRLPSIDQKGRYYGDAPEATARLGVFFSWCVWDVGRL